MNCIDCFNMKVKNRFARCKEGHFPNLSGDGDRLFNCQKQIERDGVITGFTRWEKASCLDFTDNSPISQSL